MEDLSASIGIARRECPATIVLAIVVDDHIDGAGVTIPMGILRAPGIMLTTAITPSVRRRRRLWRTWFRST